MREFWQAFPLLPSPLRSTNRPTQLEQWRQVLPLVSISSRPLPRRLWKPFSAPVPRHRSLLMSGAWSRRLAAQTLQLTSSLRVPGLAPPPGSSVHPSISRGEQGLCTGLMFGLLL